MEKLFLVNGKVTYPNGEQGSMTTFYLTNVTTGESFSLTTADEAEAESLNYGDTAKITIEKAAGGVN